MGATPVYGSSGALYASASLPATHVPNYPATVAAGDLCLAVGWGKTSAPLTEAATVALSATATSAGWAAVTAQIQSGDGSCALLVAWRIADGDEGGTAMEGGFVMDGAATADLALAIIHRFTAADDFAADPIEDEATSEATSATYSAPTITPGDVNRLGVAIAAFNDDGENATAFTGASGGVWVQRSDAPSSLGSDGTLNLQTADLSAGDAISGGSTTLASSCLQLKLKLALVPA